MIPAGYCHVCGWAWARCRAIAQISGDDHDFAPAIPGEFIDFDPNTGELIERRPNDAGAQQVRAGIHRRSKTA